MLRLMCRSLENIAEQTGYGGWLVCSERHVLRNHADALVDV